MPFYHSLVNSTLTLIVGIIDEKTMADQSTINIIDAILKRLDVELNTK